MKHSIRTIAVVGTVALAVVVPSFVLAAPKATDPAIRNNAPTYHTAPDGHKYTTSTAVDQPGAAGGAVTFLGKTSPEMQHWQAEMEKMQKEIQAIVKIRMDEFSKAPEYVAASTAVSDAQKEVSAARAEAVDAVRSDPKYQQASLERSRLNQELEQMKQDGATAQERADVLQKIARAASLMSRMEDQAVKTNEKLQAALSRQSTAQAAMLSLRAQFESSLQGDPSWTAANQKLETARTKYAEAAANANKGQPGKE